MSDHIRYEYLDDLETLPPKWPFVQRRSLASIRTFIWLRKLMPEQAGALGNWLDERVEEMADAIGQLVAVPTQNPPGESYGKCADLLQEMVRQAGIAYERFEATDSGDSSAACLLARHGTLERTLYFHGHYDVVPAQSAEQFSPRREKNYLFGRGSCDMKSGLVAMLYAIRALKETGTKLKGTVALALVCDEETGGARGSVRLAKEGLLGRNGVGMLTAEPTSGIVWNANRGAITLRVEVQGKSAHVGLQHKGENAFERMHTVAARLLDLKHEVEQRKTAHLVGPEDPEPPSTSANKRGPLHSIMLLGGESRGGTNFNVVPDQCWFTIDRRINPEEDFDTEKQRLIDVLEGCRRSGIPLRWQVLQEGHSASCGENEPLGRALSRSVAQVTGRDPKFEMCPGLLEIRFYAQCGVPAYAYGPGLLSVAHGPEEYVDLRRVRDCALIYALTAADMLKP